MASKEVSTRVSDTTLSIYYDQQPAKPEAILQQVARLKVAFPNNNDPLFYTILTEELVESGMSEQQLKDAIRNVIRHNQYKSFSIADIFNFDKRVKFYTWSEVRQLAGEFPSPKFPRMKFKCERGEYFKWVRYEDAIEFNLPIDSWENQKQSNQF
jgi:hypothetical protein